LSDERKLEDELFKY
jgi:hypothetical protein